MHQKRTAALAVRSSNYTLRAISVSHTLTFSLTHKLTRGHMPLRAHEAKRRVAAEVVLRFEGDAFKWLEMRKWLTTSHLEAGNRS
mmetsp:Transcript_29577/g.66948  ORF Transcript_29577/g.66948 Transcript_29577/m.66948 type:complete len:85 (+) Transcript_29577:439-693(+)